MSRSYYSRLIPADRSAQFYGFYNMLGKFAAILGPALMGTVGLAAKRLMQPVNPTAEQMAHISSLASRFSIGSIAVLFVIGAVLLCFVDEKRGRREAQYLSGMTSDTG